VLFIRGGIGRLETSGGGHGLQWVRQREIICSKELTYFWIQNCCDEL